MNDWARTVEEVQEVPGPSVTAKHRCKMVSPTSRCEVTSKQDAPVGPKRDNRLYIRDKIPRVAEFASRVRCTKEASKGQPRFPPASIGRLRVRVRDESWGGCARIICLVPEPEYSRRETTRASRCGWQKKETRRLSSAQRNPTQHNTTRPRGSRPIEGVWGKALAQALDLLSCKRSGQEEMGRDGHCKDVQSTGTIAAN